MGFLSWLFGYSFGNFDDLGDYGEYLTRNKLNMWKIDGLFNVLSNVYVPNGNGFTELDIVMIHEKGVFVFESKNYSGWIFGSADNQYWTQCLPSKKKNRFYNPILQNKTHINALSKYARIKKKHIFSYIVFSERCELKDVPDDTDEYKIMRRQYLVRNLNDDLYFKDCIYTEEQIDKLTEILENLCDVDNEVKERHIENIKKKHK